MTIVFSTNNQNKLSEIRQILGSRFDIVSLADIGCHEDIPETGQTLEENARLKAQYVFDHYHLDCFADDTGLEVEALGGEPGVHSARYADDTDHDSEANMAKLLRRLGDNENRRAQFRTVICLIQKGDDPAADPTVVEFEGKVTGHIATRKQGTEGFGYDPLFVPDGYDQSFAELGLDIKNRISHRARAVKKLADYLLSGEK
jgi:XTP/dITP diphosphohydrolase